MKYPIINLFKITAILFVLFINSCTKESADEFSFEKELGTGFTENVVLYADNDSILYFQNLGPNYTRFGYIDFENMEYKDLATIEGGKYPFLTENYIFLFESNEVNEFYGTKIYRINRNNLNEAPQIVTLPSTIYDNMFVLNDDFLYFIDDLNRKLIRKLDFNTYETTEFYSDATYYFHDLIDDNENFIIKEQNGADTSTTLLYRLNKQTLQKELIDIDKKIFMGRVENLLAYTNDRLIETSYVFLPTDIDIIRISNYCFYENLNSAMDTEGYRYYIMQFPASRNILLGYNKETGFYESICGRDHGLVSVIGYYHGYLYVTTEIGAIALIKI